VYSHSLKFFRKTTVLSSNLIVNREMGRDHDSRARHGCLLVMVEAG
jgi:hypothetical protein